MQYKTEYQNSKKHKMKSAEYIDKAEEIDYTGNTPVLMSHTQSWTNASSAVP